MCLRHVSDALPGIRRERRGKAFVYRQPDARPVRDAAVLARIRALAIPPAYTDVWICPWPDGHLQATGRDARGRKQYRYHAAWNLQRNADKFGRLEAFGEALPRIRRRVSRDLAHAHGSLRRKVILATLVRLLDTTYLRVGNDAYARENGSYGLSTLRDRHARVDADSIRLRFRGKHGVEHEVTLRDRRLAGVIRRCKQLPGQALFQYEEDGVVHGIDSGDVNDYLAEAAGERFTAKDFRSWHGTVEALRLACAHEDDARLRISRVIGGVARSLGNTEAVCRKSYIHPAVLGLCHALADDARAQDTLAALQAPPPAGPAGLRADERRLLAFLATLRA
ncbi:MAG: DNA topoisomerase IB [Candidatus Dactylopiibacterium sp.]|nr:DNA topoisomerase IB [Candidatus Dactylopiibacterium sp.]